MNDGGPAFPQPCTKDGFAANSPFNIAGGGMSLRDWFAGMALQGLYASGRQPIETGVSDTYAAEAFQAANAMLSARDHEAKPKDL